MLLGSFDRACSIYATIETLGAATDIEDIRKYALLPDNADATIELLRTEIDALKSTNIQNELKRARSRAALIQSLKSIIEAGKAFNVAKYAAIVEACREAKHRRDEAGSKAFDGLGIPGVLTDEWRTFIHAGEDYLKKHATEGYPHEPDSCAYCQQPLTAKALELIRKYRGFTSNEIKIAFDKAERELSKYLAPITALKADALEEQYVSETSGGGDVLTAVAPVLQQIKNLAARIASNSAITWPDKEAALAAAEKIVSEESTRMTSLVSRLEASIEERQQALEKRQTDFIELQGKRTANSLLPQIERRVSDAKWVFRANIVKNGMSGILRSLTEAAKEASEELLNKGFEKRFQDECRKLRAPNVTLNFPGRQGQVTRRKMVAAYKPNQVLSEGEQKALALADFIAEVTAVPASSPIIFDDPITSIYYRRFTKSVIASWTSRTSTRSSCLRTTFGSQPSFSRKATRKGGSFMTSDLKAGIAACSHPLVIPAWIRSPRSATA